MSGVVEESLLSLPAKLLSETGTLRLREPPTSDVSDLVRRLRDGDYGKPFVVDDGRMRRLHFSLDFVQSEMDLAEPYALNFAYTRKMMAFLLFVPRPKHIIIVGLGGGSLTKFCYKQLPAARITTVEIDDDVIGFGRLFEVPEPDTRLRLVHADAVDYLAQTETAADVILVDGCDRHGVAEAFCDPAFYRSVHARLQPRGMLVMNLIGTGRKVNEHLHHIADVFEGRVMLRSLRGCGNRLVFAFKDPTYAPDWSAIQRTAKRLEKEHGLDFSEFARKLRQSRQFQAVMG